MHNIEVNIHIVTTSRYQVHPLGLSELYYV